METNNKLLTNTKGSAGTEQVMVVILVGVLGVGGFTALGSAMKKDVAGDAKGNAPVSMATASQAGLGSVGVHDPEWCSYHVGQCVGSKIVRGFDVHPSGKPGIGHTKQGGGGFLDGIKDALLGAGNFIESAVPDVITNGASGAFDAYSNLVNRAFGGIKNVAKNVFSGFGGGVFETVKEIGERLMGVPFLPNGGLFGESGLVSRAFDSVGDFFGSPLLGTVLPIPGLFGDHSVFGRMADAAAAASSHSIFDPIGALRDGIGTLLHGRVTGYLRSGGSILKQKGFGPGKAIGRGIVKGAAEVAKEALKHKHRGLFGAVVDAAREAAIAATKVGEGILPGTGIKKGTKLNPVPTQRGQKKDFLTDPTMDAARADLADARALTTQMAVRIAASRATGKPVSRAFADKTYVKVNEAWNALAGSINAIDEQLKSHDISKVYRKNLLKLRKEMMSTLGALDPLQKKIDARADKSVVSARAGQVRIGKPSEIPPVAQGPKIWRELPGGGNDPGFSPHSGDGKGRNIDPGFSPAHPGSPCANHGPTMECRRTPGNGVILN